MPQPAWRLCLGTALDRLEHRNEGETVSDCADDLILAPAFQQLRGLSCEVRISGLDELKVDWHEQVDRDWQAHEEQRDGDEPETLDNRPSQK
nr:hypothetical protein [uncultured Roseobacter sp.]